MKCTMKLFYSLSIISLLVVIACATTKLTSVWKDETYQRGPVKKVFVMGFAQKPAIRNLFEDEFVKQLKARGTDAVASYTVIPFDQMLEKETMVSKIKDLRTDAVLITRVVGRRGIRTYDPGGTWYDHYNKSFRYTQSPGYATEEDVAVLETTLYETRTEKLIWSAQSESLAMGVDRKRIRSFVKLMIEKLIEDKLVR